MDAPAAPDQDAETPPDNDAGSPPAGSELLVDDTSPGFAASSAWVVSAATAGFYGSGYRVRPSGVANDPASYTVALPRDGTYRVSVRWTAGSDRASSAPYLVTHTGGTSAVRIDERQNNGVWARLGVFDFAKGSAVRVQVSADAPAGANVVADAVKFEAVPPRWSGWSDATSDFKSLPAGVRVHRKTDASIPLRWTAVDVDLGAGTTIVRSFMSTKQQTVPSWQTSTGAVAALNAGFFGSNGESYAAVVDGAAVLARNIAAVNRSGVTFPVTRGFFGVTSSSELAVDWIYNFGPAVTDIYRFGAPLPNTTAKPAGAPLAKDGTQIAGVVAGVGGGPVLVKDGVRRVTWTEEVFWGSGVDLAERNPRSGVCYTADRHVVLIAVDGRQSGTSEGIGLPDFADAMLDLGCIGGLNLDGGGSTGLAIGGAYINSPSEKRAVTSVLAIVPK